MKSNIFRGRGVTERAKWSFYKKYHLPCNSSTTCLANSVPFIPLTFKTILILSIFLIILFSFIPITEALGVRPAQTKLDFKPGEEITIGITIVNTDKKDFDALLGVEGILSEYIEFAENKITFTAEEEQKEATAKLKYPLSLPPGTHTAYLVISEESPKIVFTEDMISAQISLKHRITLEVPIDGKYVEAQLEYREQQDTVDVITTVKNKGKEELKQVITELNVYEDTTNLGNFESAPTPMQPAEVKKFYSSISKEKTYQGVYDLVSTITYDDKIAEVKKKMSIGSPEINIMAFDKFFKENAINKIIIDLENNWNQEITNAYAIIELQQNGKDVIQPTRTTSIDVPARNRKSLNSFLDLTGVNTGDYICKVTLNYLDKTAEKTQEVKVITEDEYGKQTKSSSKIILIIVVLLVLIVVLLLALILIAVYILRKKP